MLGKTLYLVVLVQAAAVIGGPALNIYLTGAAQSERVCRDRLRGDGAGRPPGGPPPPASVR